MCTNGFDMLSNVLECGIGYRDYSAIGTLTDDSCRGCGHNKWNRLPAVREDIVICIYDSWSL